MRRVTAAAVRFFSMTIVFSSIASQSSAQDPRQRQAAAEAYDRGTTAYLEGSYEEAGKWFETANRMAPAAPALMQAIRAHEHYDNKARAATLALELSRTYHNDKAAADFASGVLNKDVGELLRIEVTCDEDCKLDVDGKLQEFTSFFVLPGKTHALTATFETGSKSATVDGAAGETRSVEFQAPPPPPTPPIASSRDTETNSQRDESHPPLTPVYTWVGVGITAALGIATIISGVNTVSGKSAYDAAAAKAMASCGPPATEACTMDHANAQHLLDSGQGKELRTNVLIGATAFAAVGTGVIALFLTDWSGKSKSHESSASLAITPLPGGVMSVVKGQF